MHQLASPNAIIQHRQTAHNMGCYSLCARECVELAISLVGHLHFGAKIRLYFQRTPLFKRKMAVHPLDFVFGELYR